MLQRYKGKRYGEDVRKFDRKMFVVSLWYGRPDAINIPGDRWLGPTSESHYQRSLGYYIGGRPLYPVHEN